MTSVHVVTILSEEQKIERIVEVLRTADSNLVFKAFCEAPTPNLIAMREMIEHILTHREDVPDCECDLSE